MSGLAPNMLVKFSANPSYATLLMNTIELVSALNTCRLYIFRYHLDDWNHFNN